MKPTKTHIKKENIYKMFKPKCYKEFNPKDVGRQGKKCCLGEPDYTTGNDSPILGELKPFDVESKCKACKYYNKNINY